jgi:hypothetical protein
VLEPEEDGVDAVHNTDIDVAAECDEKGDDKQEEVTQHLFNKPDGCMKWIRTAFPKVRVGECVPALGCSRRSLPLA